jgi:sugar lactone lactonase YvrE
MRYQGGDIMKTIEWGGIAMAAAALGLVAAGTAAAGPHARVHPVPAVAIQVIAAFDNPEAVIFSADGRWLFVSNSAELGDRSGGLSFGAGEGYISKLEVLPSGRLKMVEEKLIDGITAPLGMGVLPVATDKFPAGTIFVCAGSALQSDSSGQPITDPARLRSKLIAFDVDGNVLGEIDTGTGSVFDQINGSPIVLINALGFDREGNLYVADTAFGGAQYDPPVTDKSGLWKIPHESLDALAGGMAAPTPPSFMAIPGNPDGVEMSPIDGKIYVNTVGPVAGAPDPAGGGIYALTDVGGTLPAPFDRDLGALDGLDFTDGGTMLNTQIKGDVPTSLTVNCPNQPATQLEIEPSGPMVELAGPADIAIRGLSDGTTLVVVPELTARDATPGDDEITVLALPPEFDAACGG